MRSPVHRRAARRPLRRTLATVVAAAGLLAIVAAGVPTASPPAIAAAPADRLPDLRMARIRELHVKTTPNGRRLLRFTTWIVNVGAGPFEVRGRRASTRASTMAISQRIYNTAGGYRTVRTPAVMRYAGDGHDHWHAQKIATYELWSNVNPATVYRGAKVGFCFFDTNGYKFSLRRAPRTRHYLESTCGVRRSTSALMGISVGWADSYPWNFAYQWVDITHLRPGVYTLRVSVDKENWFRESNDRNNCNWSRIRIGSGSSVRVLAVGTSSCPAPPRPAPTPSPTPTPTPTPSLGPTPAPTAGATPVPTPIPSTPPAGATAAFGATTLDPALAALDPALAALDPALAVIDPALLTVGGASWTSTAEPDLDFSCPIPGAPSSPGEVDQAGGPGPSGPPLPAARAPS